MEGRAELSTKVKNNLWYQIAEFFLVEAKFLAKIDDLEKSVHSEIQKEEEAASEQEGENKNRALRVNNLERFIDHLPLNTLILNSNDNSMIELLYQLYNVEDAEAAKNSKDGKDGKDVKDVVELVKQYFEKGLPPEDLDENALSRVLQAMLNIINIRIQYEYHQAYIQQNVKRPSLTKLEGELNLEPNMTNKTILATQQYPRYRLLTQNLLQTLGGIGGERLSVMQRNLRDTDEQLNMFLLNADKEEQVFRYSELAKELDSSDIEITEEFLESNPLFALYHDLDTYKNKKSDPTYRVCAEHFMNFVEQFKKHEVINVQNIDSILAASPRYKHFVEKMLAKFYDHPIEFEYELEQFQKYTSGRDLTAQLLPPTSPISPIISFLFYPSPPASPKSSNSSKKVQEPAGQEVKDAHQPSVPTKQRK